MSDTLMISVSGMRGHVGTDLTPELVARHAAALGAWVRAAARPGAGAGTGSGAGAISRAMIFGGRLAACCALLISSSGRPKSSSACKTSDARIAR